MGELKWEMKLKQQKEIFRIKSGSLLKYSLNEHKSKLHSGEEKISEFEDKKKLREQK